MALFRLGEVLSDADERPWIYPHLWSRQRLATTERIILAPRDRQVSLLSSLVETMPEPLWLLYVLLVSRSGHVPGRYQSPIPENRQFVRDFLLDFRNFLEQDGRHNLWIGSATSPAMLVWDHHNRIFGYGPVDKWSEMAVAGGLQQCEPERLHPPSPHSHHYHQELDAEEDRILACSEWHRTPLQKQDDE